MDGNALLFANCFLVECIRTGVGSCVSFVPSEAVESASHNKDILIIIIIMIIIRNLYSAIMPLGGYRGAGGPGR